MNTTQTFTSPEFLSGTTGTNFEYALQKAKYFKAALSLSLSESLQLPKHPHFSTLMDMSRNTVIASRQNLCQQNIKHFHCRAALLPQ